MVLCWVFSKLFHNPGPRDETANLVCVRNIFFSAKRLLLNLIGYEIVMENNGCSISFDSMHKIQNLVNL